MSAIGIPEPNESDFRINLSEYYKRFSGYREMLEVICLAAHFKRENARLKEKLDAAKAMLEQRGYPSPNIDAYQSIRNERDELRKLVSEIPGWLDSVVANAQGALEAIDDCKQENETLEAR